MLHGLYGSSRNWQRVGKQLAEGSRILAADLRNHGLSPHSDDCSYEAMAADVLELMEVIAEPVDLMGHSLGGKVAMRVACDAGSRVRSLQILDIAPRRYEPDVSLLDALLGLDLDLFASRREVDEHLAASIPDVALRGFLLTNLQRTASGGFEWQANLQGLRAGLGQIGDSSLLDGDRFAGPVDVVAGRSSDYVTDADRELFEGFFPMARLHFLDGVGHNVHVEGGERFVQLVLASRERGS